jgi:hypothetical protein
MTYFQELNNLTVYYNLLDELSKLDSVWQGNQICINSVRGHEKNTSLGAGSLYYDWDNSYSYKDQHGNEKLHVPPYENPLDENDFGIVCDQFKGTVFQDIYNELNEIYVLGRLRLMRSKPKTCLSWHTDQSPRLHYPVKTQEGCYMVINDQVKYLEQNKWYYTETTKPHTAFNASKEDRIHLVGVILEDRRTQ